MATSPSRLIYRDMHRVISPGHSADRSHYQYSGTAVLHSGKIRSPTSGYLRRCPQAIARLTTVRSTDYRLLQSLRIKHLPHSLMRSRRRMRRVVIEIRPRSSTRRSRLIPYRPPRASIRRIRQPILLRIRQHLVEKQPPVAHINIRILQLALQVIRNLANEAFSRTPCFPNPGIFSGSSATANRRAPTL